MNHFFVPTLYDDPVVDANYDYWINSHIWLHKQPLFHWQSTICFRLFGVSEFTMRLPSALLAAAIAAVAYRCGSVLVSNRAGFLTATFFVSSHYMLELISGFGKIDHNDMSFVAYVTFSIWAFIEYETNGNRKWIYLIGLFAGCAILCKWLVGLLVYSGWFAHKLAMRQFHPRHYGDLLKALSVTILIAAPWQMYTFWYFPGKAAWEMKSNSMHFWEVIEGHGGGELYHLYKIPELYGWLIAILFVPSLLLFRSSMKQPRLFVPLFVIILVTYEFFTLAATKMPSFTLIAALPVYLGAASLLDLAVSRMLTLTKNVNVLGSVCFIIVLAIFISRLDVPEISANHTNQRNDNWYVSTLTRKKELFTSLDLPRDAVIFNVKDLNYIEAMFYTGLPAYNFMPDESTVKNLRETNRPIAVFARSKKELPPYLANEHGVLLLRDEQ